MGRLVTPTNSSCPRECLPVKLSLKSQAVTPQDLADAVQRCHVTSVYLLWLKNQEHFESNGAPFYDALVKSKVTQLEVAYFGCKTVDALGKVLAKTSIKDLILRGNECYPADDGFQKLFSALSSSQVERLDMGYTNMEGGAIFFLTPHLAKAKQLTTLDFNSCEIGDGGLKRLASTLPMMGNVKSLELRYNKLTGEGVKYLAEFLKESKLTDLSLEDNTKLGDGVLPIVENLPGSSITSLKLKRIYDYDKDAEHLSDPCLTALAAPSKEPLSRVLPKSNLTSLDVSNNQICNYFESGECAWGQPFIKALPKSRLSNLNLERTRMNNLPVRFLPELLSVPNLNLEANMFEDKFANALAQQLPNSSVKSLSLSGCRFSLKAVETLAKALPSSNITSFKVADSLDVRDRKYEKENAGRFIDKVFALILPLCPRLQALDLGSSFTSASEIITVLPKTNLTSLGLRRNEDVQYQVYFLASQLPKTKLQTLDLYECGDWDSDYIKSFARAIPQSSLKELNIERNNLDYYEQRRLTRRPVYNKLGEKLSLKYTE
eukprot:s1829_g5.t1